MKVKKCLSLEWDAIAGIVAAAVAIVLHLLHVLRRKQLKRGIATICIGGGLGGAMLVEPC